jgi:hypothetical protein
MCSRDSAKSRRGSSCDAAALGGIQWPVFCKGRALKGFGEALQQVVLSVSRRGGPASRGGRGGAGLAEGARTQIRDRPVELRPVPVADLELRVVLESIEQFVCQAGTTGLPVHLHPAGQAAMAPGRQQDAQPCQQDLLALRS